MVLQSLVRKTESPPYTRRAFIFDHVGVLGEKVNLGASVIGQGSRRRASGLRNLSLSGLVVRNALRGLVLGKSHQRERRDRRISDRSYAHRDTPC